MLDKETTPSFELVLCVKNAKGEVTGHRKSIGTDNPAKLSEFYNKYRGKPNRKPKSKKNSK